MKTEYTSRGFALIKFTDRYSSPCSIQRSSLATDEAIWFGVDDAAPKIMASQAAAHGLEAGDGTGWVPFPVPDDVSLTTRMHLTRAQVAELLPILQNFVATGEAAAPAITEQPEAGEVSELKAQLKQRNDGAHREREKLMAHIHKLETALWKFGAPGEAALAAIRSAAPQEGAQEVKCRCERKYGQKECTNCLDQPGTGKGTGTAPTATLTRCAAGRDGECTHAQCPQLRDCEPTLTGRHCPLDTEQEDD